MGKLLHEPEGPGSQRCKHCGQFVRHYSDSWEMTGSCPARIQASHQQTIALLVGVARALVESATRDSSPAGREVRKRMESPQIGDLVLVLDPYWHNRSPAYPETTIGILKRILEFDDAEPLQDPEDPKDPKDPNLCPIDGDRVYVLERLDGAESRWFNATVWAIPQRPSSFTTTRNERDS